MRRYLLPRCSQYVSQYIPAEIILGLLVRINSFRLSRGRMPVFRPKHLSDLKELNNIRHLWLSGYIRNNNRSKHSHTASDYRMHIHVRSDICGSAVPFVCHFIIVICRKQQVYDAGRSPHLASDGNFIQKHHRQHHCQYQPKDAVVQNAENRTFAAMPLRQT